MKTFFAGIPTEIDVRSIREAFPDEKLTSGMKISHGEIEPLINCDRKSYRYKTVTSRWRKLVENATNKVVAADPGVGFVVLSEIGKVGLSGTKLRSAGRIARRSYVLAARVDCKELTDEQRRELDFITKKTSAMLTAARLKPTAELPEM